MVWMEVPVLENKWILADVPAHWKQDPPREARLDGRIFEPMVMLVLSL